MNNHYNVFITYKISIFVNLCQFMTFLTLYLFYTSLKFFFKFDNTNIRISVNL